MTLPMHTKVRRRKNIIYKEIDGIVYILDHRNSTIHTLNETASFLWKKLETPTTLERLVKLVSDTYEVDRRTATKDIQNLIAKYLHQKFLVTV